MSSNKPISILFADQIDGITHPMGFITSGGNFHDSLPPPPPPGGPGGPGGPGDDENHGMRKWSLGQEVIRNSSGQTMARVTVGYDGYTFSVLENPPYGDAKTTGHKSGDLHRHGYMSDTPFKDDFIRSNLPHWGLLDVIGKPNPGG
jgi:hypothetical protein